MNEDPIEHYAYKILGRKQWYEQTFEDYDEEDSQENEGEHGLRYVEDHTGISTKNRALL